MRTADAATGSTSGPITGLTTKVPSAWPKAATSPRPTPTASRPRVASRLDSLPARLPKAMAHITPLSTSAQPSMATAPIRSPKKSAASTADIIEWVANKMPERRGPSRFMQANSTVSPMKMPIKPDSTSTPTSARFRLSQVPAKVAQPPSITVANTMRQRVKAKAPILRATGAENSAASAQQAAAKTARDSGGKGKGDTAGGKMGRQRCKLSRTMLRSCSNSARMPIQTPQPRHPGARTSDCRAQRWPLRALPVARAATTTF